jgi:gliding motility-associated-like protein
LNDYVISRPVPVADFTADPEITSIVFPEIKFTDNSVGATTWAWDFGDGDSSSVSSPIHTYSDTGTYYIYLHVENDFGCFSDDFGRVIINPFPTLWIPNAFTPDDDGINDTWFVKGTDFYDFELRIYNRWGVLMFYTSDPMQGWNGLSPKTEQEALQDVYVYTIYFRDEAGKQNRRNGSLTLVR